MNDTISMVARAKIYEIASLAFTYPEDEVMESLRGSAGEISEAMQILDATPEAYEKGMSFISSGVATDSSVVRGNYNELFTGRKQCSLDESEYDKSIFYRHQRIADISGFFRAFGFKNSEESHQRPDFIGTELEFMALLLLKRAYAIEQSWEEQAQVCLDAEGKFFSEHMEWWIPTMCEQLRGASTCAFYTSLSNFLESFIGSEAPRYLQPA